MGVDLVDRLARASDQWSAAFSASIPAPAVNFILASGSVNIHKSRSQLIVALVHGRATFSVLPHPPGVESNEFVSEGEGPRLVVFGNPVIQTVTALFDDEGCFFRIDRQDLGQSPYQERLGHRSTVCVELALPLHLVGDTMASVPPTDPDDRSWMANLSRSSAVDLFRAAVREPSNLPSVLPPKLNSFADRVYAYLDANMDRCVTAREMAKAFGVSVTTFSSTINRCFGMPAYRFIRHYRLVQASRMLRDADVTIGTIAERFGFASQSHFTNSFTGAFGVTPHRYKLQYQAA